VWNDGTTYYGHFTMGVIEGKGKIVKANRFVYDGEWLNN
jgi:hypothetical protein